MSPLYLPIPPYAVGVTLLVCISLYLPISPHISLHLPTSPYISQVVLRRAVDLRVLHRLTAGGESPPAPLHCLALTADEQFVLAGSRTGHLLIWGVPAQAIARNLLDSLDRTLGLSF